MTAAGLAALVARPGEAVHLRLPAPGTGGELDTDSKETRDG
jgi:hypothetical protein